MSNIVGRNRYWPELWRTYSASPSIAFCRVPEMEFAASLPVEGLRFLDHCCGDGLFASMAWPGKVVTAGCDIIEHSLAEAEKRGGHGDLAQCDVSEKLPFEDASFDIIFNNSGLEHVENLDAALAEIARVLAPGGQLAMNILNHRYFEWWPLDKQAEIDYRRWQPFYHALSSGQWAQHLGAANLEIQDIKGYFNQAAARDLALLDYHFSGVALEGRKSWMVSLHRALPSISKPYWQRRLAKHTWQTEPEEGAGYFIIAGHKKS